MLFKNYYLLIYVVTACPVVILWLYRNLHTCTAAVNGNVWEYEENLCNFGLHQCVNIAANILGHLPLAGRYCVDTTSNVEMSEVVFPAVCYMW